MKRTAGQLSSIIQLLDDALDLPEGERLAWVDGLPDTCADLKPTIRRLLSNANARAPDEFTEVQNRIANIVRLGVLSTHQPQKHPGARVGPYELVRQVGQGGMGTVWLAHRADGAFKRDVALKPHVAWMGQWDARMARERDILASLQHENIARFYDAGIDQSGRPFLAMEYVEGKPIDVYCRNQPMSERLRLILGVAKAVAYAHSKLVVHRDLKPSNILVTREGAIRLLDFGVAALLGPEGGTQGTRLTQLTGRALTLDYASPEQIRGESIDTASDVYSLAVVTFELLAGTRPYRLERGTAAELEQAIAEIDPRSASESAADLAAKRQLRGDLDAVLNKAMKKRPAERYPTVAAFADEIERYLNHLPVLAQPDRILYRIRKFVSRNSLPVGAAALVLVSVLGGSCVALWAAHSARIEAAHARITKDFLVSIFRSNDVRVASDKPHAERTVREVLELAATRIEDDFASDPPTQIELLGLTATIFDNQGDQVRYRQLEQRRAEIARKHYGPLHPRVIEGLLSASDAAISHDDFATSKQLLEETDQLLKRSGHDGGGPRADWLRIKARLLIHTSSDQAAPVALLEQAIAIYRTLESSNKGHADALDMLAIARAETGHVEAALPLREEAIRVAEANPDRDEATLSGYVINLARLQDKLGQAGPADQTFHRAQDLARRTFGVHSLNYWMAIAWDASLLHRIGDLQRSHTLFATLMEALPPLGTSYEEISAREIYARCLTAEGRASEAIPILEVAQRTYLANAAYEFDLRELRLTLGDAYDRAGRVDDARATLAAAHADFLANESAKSQWMHRMRERWGRFLLDHAGANSTDLADAEAEFNSVIGNPATRVHGADALAHAGLARLAAARNDTATALRQSRQALSVLDMPYFIDVRASQRVWLVHSAVLLQSGNASEVRRGESRRGRQLHLPENPRCDRPRHGDRIQGRHRVDHL